MTERSHKCNIMPFYCVAPIQQPICGHLTTLPYSGIITTLDKQTEGRKKMKTVIWQVRLEGTHWKQSFKTRKEARKYKSTTERFKDGIIVKITTERVS